VQIASNRYCLPPSGGGYFGFDIDDSLGFQDDGSIGSVASDTFNESAKACPDQGWN
jgi:hypothetical protein